MGEWLPFLERFGLPGIALGLLAWVMIKATPHIVNAVVKDRENKRKHLIAMRKLENAISERQASQESTRLI
jgi:hypothetical protein